MPEGPEIKFLGILLRNKIIGKTINDIFRFDKGVSNNLFHGNIIVNNVCTNGKLLWIETDKLYVHMHMGLSGWMYLNNNGLKYLKYVIGFTDQYNIYVDDPINLSNVNVFNYDKHISAINKLS